MPSQPTAHLPTRRVLVTFAAALLALGSATACGTSSGDDQDATSPGTQAQGAQAAAPADSASSAKKQASGKDGTVALTVGGTKSNFPSGTCSIIKTSDVNFSLSSHGLEIMLPEKPGPFADGGQAAVILPPPSGDEYAASHKAHGTRTDSGGRSTGHIEGTAELLSSFATGGDAVAFTIDFDCPLIPLGG